MKLQTLAVAALLAMTAVVAMTPTAAAACVDAGTTPGGTGSAAQAEADPDSTGPEYNSTVKYWDNTVYVYLNPDHCITQ